MLHMSSPSLFKKVIAPFLTFALMFIGAGFISGSIVHLGEGVNPWDVSILSIGVLLFMIGSYVQEILYNGKSLKEEGTLFFLFFSLLLSLGIGMVSGGTQHYVDTPSYSSYLIPIGLGIGMLAFVLKTNIKLAHEEVAKLLLGTLLFCTLLWLALVYGAATIPAKVDTHDHHGNTKPLTSSHDMNVATDEAFISNMIPHHQEAVNSSQEMLRRITDPEQKKFLENIMNVQTKEIEMLKGWHQEYFGTAYVSNGNYTLMMPKIENIKNNSDAWHAYIEGMIEHHKGAIRMSEQVLMVSKRDNLKKFARDVISTQSQEISQMNAWLSNTHNGMNKHVPH